MTETLKDMMTTRADRAPGPNLDIADVIRTGQRRVWRRRAACGTAACVVLAALALIAPSILPSGDDSPSFAGGLGERQISYASGSTIHYGDQSIDVSPHQLSSYVLTNDGFVYATKDGEVYFTDGGDSTRIGHAGEDNRLVADDFGSYVGWIELDEHSDPEAVVFDTERGTEVLRTANDDGSDRGCYEGQDGIVLSAIDGTTAYICGGDGVTAWNIVTQTELETTPSRPGFMPLQDVADGYLAWSTGDGPDTGRGSVVSREPEARKPRYRQVAASQLSPDADYIVGIQVTGDSWRSLVVDRESSREVELAMPTYQEWYVMQWIDDERFTAVGFGAADYEGDSGDAPQLLTCDITAAACTVVGQASGADFLLPTGLSYWS